MKPRLSYRTAAIILAAGESKRLGRPKQMVILEGRTLLERAVTCALDSPIETVLAVLGSQGTIQKELLELQNVKIVINKNWREGISSSIKAGLDALREFESDSNVLFDSVLFLTCDQPYLSPKLISEIVEKQRSSKAKIVASSYSDSLGIPALFGKTMFDELAQLQGDAGAKILIQKYLDSVESVPFPSGEIDIDTDHDLQEFEALMKKFSTEN